VAAALRDWSKHLPEVYFLQVGASDGFYNDPIVKFVKTRGWRGLVLEPQPEPFEVLTAVYHNDRVQAVRAAIAAQDGDSTLYRIAFSKERWATGKSSFRKEILLEAIARGSLQKQAEKHGIELTTDPQSWIEGLSVPTVTFGTLLRRYALPRVDLLLVDTEGFDLEILKLWDFDQYGAPAVIVFEHAHLDSSDREIATRLLRTKGYELRELGADTLALRTAAGSA
jgi:FkbM family methyltransferase